MLARRVVQGTCRLCHAALSPATSRAVASPSRASSSTSTIATARRHTPRLTSRARESAVPAQWAQRRHVMIQADVPKPSPDDDFEPVEPDQAKMELSDSAISQIIKAQQKASDTSLALRVIVESGGCHGYQYKMQMTAQDEPDDYIFRAPGSTARMFVDAASLTLLSGAKIDYTTELIGSSFKVVNNPHADDKSGCGCGVSWDLKPL